MKATTGLRRDTAVSDLPDVASLQQLAHYWTEAVALPAGPRLALARRYQDQYDRLDLEFPNLRAVHVWLVRQRQSRPAARLLIDYAIVLAPYLQHRGRAAELLRWCDDGLRACAYLQENPGVLLLLRYEAQFVLSQWEAAHASLVAALTAGASGDAPTYARAVLALGRLQLNRGEYEAALRNLAKAQALLTAVADIPGLSTVLAEKAAYHLNRRELDTALALYLEADQLDRQNGATAPSDRTLLMLGVVYRKKRDYPRATAYLQQAMSRGESQQYPALIATAAHHLAWVRLDQGDLQRARRLSGHALTLYRSTGDIRGTADTYEQLGLLTLAGGRVQQAWRYLDRAVVLRRQVGNKQGVASSLRRRAIAYVHTGHVLAAVYDLWESFGIYHQLQVLTPQQLGSILWEFFALTVPARRYRNLRWRRGV